MPVRVLESSTSSQVSGNPPFLPLFLHLSSLVAVMKSAPSLSIFFFSCGNVLNLCCFKSVCVTFGRLLSTIKFSFYFLFDCSFALGANSGHTSFQACTLLGVGQVYFFSFSFYLFIYFFFGYISVRIHFGSLEKWGLWKGKHRGCLVIFLIFIALPCSFSNPKEKEFVSFCSVSISWNIKNLIIL